MSKRVHSLTVVLGEDISEERCQKLKDALSCFHGVSSVRENVTDIASVMAEERALTSLSKKLWDVLHPERTP